MVNINQSYYRKKYKNYYIKLRGLNKCPQKKGICLKVYTTSPKKPNSALRKVAKVRITSNKLKPQVIAGIPGLGHDLQDYSIVLIRGGRVNDVPGVRYKIIRGKYDFISSEVIIRRARRSKFGVPRSKMST